MQQEIKLVLEGLRKKYMIPELECKIYYLPKDLQELKLIDQWLSNTVTISTIMKIPGQVSGAVITLTRLDMETIVPNQIVEIITDTGVFSVPSLSLFEMYMLTGKPMITLRHVRRKQ